MSLDVPWGWDAKIFMSRANPVAWLTPPRAQHGQGRLVLATASDASGQDDLVGWLTRFIADGANAKPSPAQTIVVGTASMTCVEYVDATTAWGACGRFQPTGATTQALAWAFIQAVDPPFYRSIGGVHFLAETAASLRDLQLPEPIYAPFTPSP